MDLYPHAQAILGSLQAAGLTVGDHVAPKSPNGSFVAPCVVLYLRPGGQLVDSTTGQDPDGSLPFQLTCVGRTASEALDQADLAYRALHDFPPTVDGWAIHHVRKTYSGSTAQRDDDITPPLFYVPVECRLVSSLDDDGS